MCNLWTSTCHIPSSLRGDFTLNLPSYCRYLPYITYRNEAKKNRRGPETRESGVFRAVAIVAQSSISHGEELFADYLEDQRASVDFVPDWLLEPPPPATSVYLHKKELTSRIPYTVQLLYSYQVAK